MGTFQYMAPEQLEGNDADSRTDIFAFGCVLYEMATGRKAFTGASQASLMTAIMSKEPEPISALAPMSPPALDRLVKTCLAKDPDDRWQSSHDVMAELRWIAEAGSQAGAPAVVASRRRSRERYAWAIAAAATAVAFAQGFWHRGQAPVPGRIFRSVISLPPGPIVDGTDSSLALSPDGRILALALRDSGGSSQIYLRTLDSLSVTPLSGTQRATCPFWSPDGKSVGFFADRKLKRIEIAGGAVQTICDAPEGRGGAWGPDGTIVFAPSLFGALSRVAASGGTAVPAEPPVSARTVSHRYPNFLPGGKTVLFYANDTEEKGDGSVIALDLATQKERLVLRAPSAAYFILPGYLAFVRQKNVMVQRFDPKSLRLSGEAVPIAENVVCNQNRGTGEFTFAGTSLFLYQTEETPQQSHLVWFDIDGKKLSSVGEPAAFDGLAIAPDGRRVAAAIDGLDGFQIWMIDLVSGVRTRFTFDVEEAINPVWSPDGSRLAYAGRVAGRAIVQVRDAGGGSPAQTIFSGPNFCNTTDWSPDGSALSFTTQSSDTRSSDIGALPITGDHKPRMILASSANEYRASFSPDGRWLAYISDESGSPELYVTLYTGTGGKWQISSGAMATFWWNGPGEIYYSTSGGQAFAVAIKPRGTGLDIGVARRIFGETQIPRDIAMSYSLALKRFLLALPVGEPQRPPITLVTNWAAALEKR
jgi:Tol biopolymer transport system component